MKVDPRLTPNLDSTNEPTRITDRIGTQQSRPGAPAPVSDQVALSPDVRLAQEAVQAANQASDIRPAEVARAKALLSQGLIGNDLESLASKIIDSLIQP